MQLTNTILLRVKSNVYYFLLVVFYIALIHKAVVDVSSSHFPGNRKLHQDMQILLVIVKTIWHALITSSRPSSQKEKLQLISGLIPVNS